MGTPQKDEELQSEKFAPKVEMTNDVMAERAAEWGLVLKSDAGTGKTSGVTTRRSGDRKLVLSFQIY